jgi:tellurite resistance protein TehA-like permease
LIQARRKVEFEAGRFRVPGGNVLPVLVLLILMVAYIPDIIGGGWVLWAYSIGWYCLGLIIYSYYSRKKQEKTDEEV